MNNLTTLCCVGAVIGMLFLFMISMLLRNLFGGVPSANANPANPIEPTYDDPNIQGQGSFGRRGIFGNIRPTYNDPNIRGRGSFGRMFGGLPSRRSGGSKFGGGSSGRVDSGNVEGRGSFGRDKD